MRCGGRGSRTYRRALPATHDLRASKGSISYTLDGALSLRSKPPFDTAHDAMRTTLFKGAALLSEHLVSPCGASQTFRNLIPMSPVGAVASPDRREALTASRSSVPLQFATLPGQEVLLRSDGTGRDLAIGGWSAVRGSKIWGKYSDEACHWLRGVFVKLAFLAVNGREWT
jgi:hypothetical protein